MKSEFFDCVYNIQPYHKKTKDFTKPYVCTEVNMGDYQIKPLGLGGTLPTP